MRAVCTTLLALFACLAVANADAGPGVELGGHVFRVEVADATDERARGLMFRQGLDTNSGMLFIFGSAAPRAFWMKNTLIPLDILYFDSEKRLVSISADTPPCRRDPCPGYPSSFPAQYVLELNAGTISELGIEIGQTFKLVELE